MEAYRKVRVAGSQEGIRRAAEGLDAFSAAHGLPASATWPFQVALDEMLSNIVHHGYGSRADGEIEVQFRLHDGTLEVEISDDAGPFNPLTAPEPDTAAPAAERPIGGLGIALTRKLMEAVEYERRGERNHVILRRRIGGAGEGRHHGDP
jgi:anti-sigma regulatory factor (Ser/Thr protein kinase)